MGKLKGTATALKHHKIGKYLNNDEKIEMVEMLKAPAVITESFSAFFRSPKQYIIMSIVYLFSSMLVTGALLGIWLLAFIFLLLLNLVTAIGIYVLAPLGFVLFVLAAYFLFSFAGGFFDACSGILGRRGTSATYFLEYSLRRGLTFFGAGVIFLAPIIIVGILVAALNLYVDNTILLAASILLFIVVSLVIFLLFLFILPAAVIDGVGSAGAVVRSAKTVLFNLLDFIILLLFLFFFSGILAVIPIIGWIAAPLVGLPVMANSLLLFYKSLRRT